LPALQRIRRHHRLPAGLPLPPGSCRCLPACRCLLVPAGACRPAAACRFRCRPSGTMRISGRVRGLAPGWPAIG